MIARIWAIQGKGWIGKINNSEMRAQPNRPGKQARISKKSNAFALASRVNGVIAGCQFSVDSSPRLKGRFHFSLGLRKLSLRRAFCWVSGDILRYSLNASSKSSSEMSLVWPYQSTTRHPCKGCLRWFSCGVIPCNSLLHTAPIPGR
jgi:hypothetical protein